MKTITKYRKLLFLILIVGIFFTSCKKEIYHSFTDEERAFMVYDLGETFKLKDEVTGDTLEFKVTEKYIRYKEDFGPKLTPSRKVHYMEEGRIEFSGTNNSTSGYIYIYKDKIDQFSLGINFPYIVGFGISGDSSPDAVEDVNVNGVLYSNVYLYIDNGIYFSKTYGFIKFEYAPNNILLTRIP